MMKKWLFWKKKNPYHPECISVPLKSYSSCLWHKNKSIDYHLTKYPQFLVKNYCKNMRKNHQNSAVAGIKKIISISRLRQAPIAKLYCTQNLLYFQIYQAITVNSCELSTIFDRFFLKFGQKSATKSWGPKNLFF